MGAFVKAMPPRARSLLFLERDIEQSMLEWLQESAWRISIGPDSLPHPERLSVDPYPERVSEKDVVLESLLEAALHQLNPRMAAEALAEAKKKVLNLTSLGQAARNQELHKHLVEGVPVQVRIKSGEFVTQNVQLVDWAKPTNNDFLAVNQFTVQGAKKRRPDILLFVNGLPLGLIELKNPEDELATLSKAYQQVQTYRVDIPQLFDYNALNVVSDGLDAKAGSLTAPWEHYKRWRTLDGASVEKRPDPEDEETTMGSLKVLTMGLLNKERFLEVIRNFTAFAATDADPQKMVAAYHQYMAAKKAQIRIKKALKPKGDGRGGVIWHTQGSGKSFTMTLLAKHLLADPAFESPTIVVLTDRNDLDDQLYETMLSLEAHLQTKPIKVEDRDGLRTNLLKRRSGGIVFTTIQKFVPESGEKAFPVLSDRANVIVLTDEAHRTQYGIKAKVSAETGETKFGYAKHLRDAFPNATFVAFTGTPIENSEKSTRRVFGDDVDVYDISRSIEDETTVRIYYENRLVKLHLVKGDSYIDTEFDAITELDEDTVQERKKSKWSQLEAVVGHPERIATIAQDIVDHFETRLGSIEGKGMAVCMSRRICIDLYEAIKELRPEWHNSADDKGQMKVVITGNATDRPEYHPHTRTKEGRKQIADRFKDPDDPFKLVIVRDMWLTGFDVPCLHTMYVDKPMQGANLMQAIARVNRVFRDKNGGLIVDYIGIAHNIRKGLQEYTESDQGNVGIDEDKAVAVLQECLEVVRDQFHGFDYEDFGSNDPQEVVTIIQDAMEFILEKPTPADPKEDDPKKAFIKSVVRLSKAFALSSNSDYAKANVREVGFFQVVKAQFVKYTLTTMESEVAQEQAIKQLLSQAIAVDGVMDIYGEAGLGRQDISILSDEFLRDIRGSERKNLALETLMKLVNDKIRAVIKRNQTKGRSFKEMLEKTIQTYEARALTAAQMIERLIELAKDIEGEQKRGKGLGLNDDEMAFYDALATGAESNLKNDALLVNIARKLVQAIHENAGPDWTKFPNARARLQLAVKKLLLKEKYPPPHDKAIQLIMAQAEQTASFIA